MKIQEAIFNVFPFEFHLTWNEGGELIKLQFKFSFEIKPKIKILSSSIVLDWVKNFYYSLLDYWNFKENYIKVPHKIWATKFQIKVLKELQSLKIGEVLTYKEFSERIGFKKAYRAVGTAIFRKAKNASSFLEEAKKIGIDIEVVSPEEEILLSLKGVIYGLKDQNLVRRKCLIVDVGGGSTEFMLSEKITPKWVKSLEIGAVSLKELFQLRYPVNYRVFKSIIDYLSDKLVELPQEEVDHVIFTGGTASLLGALDLKLKIFSPYALNSHKISKDRIEKIIKKLANSDLERISKMKGMEKGREDIALPGALICFSVLEYFKKDSLILSVNGILEGTLLSLIERYN